MNKIVTGYLKVMGLKISTAVLQASESILSYGVVQQVALSGTMAEQKALGLNRGKRILHKQKMRDWRIQKQIINAQRQNIKISNPKLIKNTVTDVPVTSSTKPNLVVIPKTSNFEYESLSRVEVQAGQFGFKIKDQKKRISSPAKIEEKENLNIKVNFSERHVSGLGLNHSRKH